MMKVIVFVLVVCSLVVMAFAANANDLNFGSYARNVGMGGAGLALTDDIATGSVINPAVSAAGGTKFQFIFPSIDMNTEGATLSELQDRTSEISNTSTDDAIQLAKDFGKQRTSLNLGFVAGFAGKYGVTAEGEAQGIINPGTNFQAWVNAGAVTTPAALLAAGLIEDTSAESVNAYASTLTDNTNVTGRYIYSLPAVTYGMGFGTGNGTLFVGAKMRWLHSEVRTWDITSSVSGTNIALDAVENATQTDNGFGADLGLIYRPKKSAMQYGLVVDNFVNAKLSGIQTPTMWSAGLATQPNARFRYAIDLVNINQVYNEKTRLRMGVEWNLGSKLALRGGYSGTDFAWGFGVAGLNFAFSKEAPTMISRVLRY